MWARPGKKHLFMGNEFGQWTEWDHDSSLEWHLLEYPPHRGLRELVRDLNRVYREYPALWEGDCEPAGFRWIDADNAADNVIAFIRIAPKSGAKVVCVCNFSPVHRSRYRVGVLGPGWYREILNTDAAIYGGGNVGNLGGVEAQAHPWHQFPFSISIELPPLSVLWFAAP
jgi:1,4-alpha-glucan branching enzyme